MSKCKACGAAVLWAWTESGKKIPLNAKAVKAFTLKDTVSGDPLAVMVDTYTTHFADCPAADKFRRKK